MNTNKHKKHRLKYLIIFLYNYLSNKGALQINHLHAELNPIRHLLALVGGHHIVHLSRVRVKQHSLTDGSRTTCVLKSCDD